MLHVILTTSVFYSDVIYSVIYFAVIHPVCVLYELKAHCSDCIYFSPVSLLNLHCLPGISPSFFHLSCLYICGLPATFALKTRCSSNRLLNDFWKLPAALTFLLNSCFRSKSEHSSLFKQDF